MKHQTARIYSLERAYLKFRKNKNTPQYEKRLHTRSMDDAEMGG